MSRLPSRSFIPACLLSFALLGGCGKSGNPGARHDDASVPANIAENVEEDRDALNAVVKEDGSLPTDDWVGRWAGPEGLYLDIQPASNGKKGHYAIANRDTLDRQANYTGIAEGAVIRFVRDGQDLAVRPGNGDETGFKYLAGKTDCLIVIPGKEGYCR